MTAQVTIVLASAENVLAVPASVLKDGGRGKTVEVWDAASKSSEVRPVDVGLTNNVMAEIRSGLEEGDLVVVSGGSGAASAATSAGNTRSLLSGGGPVGGPPL